MLVDVTLYLKEQARCVIDPETWTLADRRDRAAAIVYAFDTGLASPGG